MPFALLFQGALSPNDHGQGIIGLNVAGTPTRLPNAL
jgi:hypothetical protein